MKIKILDTGLNSSKKNMDLDQNFLLNLKNQEELIIHFYDFPAKSATYGIFSKPENFFYMDKIKDSSFDLAMRPTGGGIIFHGTDFPYSVIVPQCHPKYSINTNESYSNINQAVIYALKKVLNIKDKISLFYENEIQKKSIPTFCLAQPTIYDVMFEKQKIAGAAQRRIKEGFLHQGSILLTLPKEETLKMFIKDKKILNKIYENSFPIIQNECENKINEIKKELKVLMVEYFNNIS